MRKRVWICGLVLAALWLLSCHAAGPDTIVLTAETVLESAVSAVSDSMAAVADSDPGPRRTEREVLEQMMIDPPYDFDPAQMTAVDFGAHFPGDAAVTRTTAALMANTPCETEMTVLTGSLPGPTVFVVAGVHGDEIAGWHAGNLLKDIGIRAGRLCVISPANALGAANNTRYVTGTEDLNRHFPGAAQGSTTEQLAHAIYAQIASEKPALLLDLHEARMVSPKADFLGSSLIYSDLTGIENLIFDMLLATQNGDLCSEPFEFYSPGSKGSINRTVAEGLGIPAITVETFRGYPLERRIADQLALVEYALNYYGML